MDACRACSRLGVSFHEPAPSVAETAGPEKDWPGAQLAIPHVSFAYRLTHGGDKTKVSFWEMTTVAGWVGLAEGP